jgi:hypothetical protein
MKLCARAILLASFCTLAWSRSGAAATQDPPRRASAAKPRKAKTPPPRTTAAPAPEAAPRFDFEKRAGAVDEALTVLLARRLTVLPSAEEAGERMGREAGARQVLRANAGAAAAAVIAELEKLARNDVEGHAELFTLLGEVAAEEAAIAYWSAKLASGTPRPPRPLPERKKLKEPDRPTAQRSEREDPEALIRYLALAHLYRAGRAGSEKARAAILEAAASPHREVRISAVQYTYALTRRRWKARQELEKRLPRSDQYLLYRY